jgi:hypothetical protein
MADGVNLAARLAIACMLAFGGVGVASGEGRCPPGQYPIGDANVGGCAPIPGAGNQQNGASPKPTGKWETRWGAVAEDTAPVPTGGTLATGASVSQASKHAANALAMSRCEGMGGVKCKVRLTYYNQCIAMADPIGDRVAGAITTASRAQTLEQAKANALNECQSVDGQRCEVFYSACSLSEFKKF